MADWREAILKEFVPHAARLTLVADPDGLLLEETMLSRLRERGFDLLPFDDSIAFRHAYESKYRAIWDRGENTDLVVILRSSAGELHGLPYDLLKAGRKLAFGLDSIFPAFSHRIVAALDRAEFDSLYRAQEQDLPEPMGENATKDFILRHVYGIAPELLKDPTGLLRVLLQRHYCGTVPPVILDERFVRLLEHNRAFADWPLAALLRDREMFFAFLQERWPVFLDHVAGVLGVPRGMSLSGPELLPFDHHDVRVYVDNLFIEGYLHPVRHDSVEQLRETWMAIGVVSSQCGDEGQRARMLLEKVHDAIPATDARHGDWLNLARLWAELNLLCRDGSVFSVMGEDHGKMQSGIDAAFSAWLEKRYAGLANLASSTPIMLHHLTHHLARHAEGDKHAKIALLVIDGLSLEQWLVVRNSLNERLPGVRFREQELFAWIPTLTSVSRQALFSGMPPLRFPGSFMTTDRESALWSRFWTEQGFAANELVYLRGLGDGDLAEVEEALSHPKARIAGLIINTVDNIMHGMRLGAAGMVNQVRQWAKQPWLAGCIELLLERGFQIHLVSDHGNIEARGCGRPAEGAVADARGDRARLYSDPILRRQVKREFPDAIEWEPVGLPLDRLALLAPSRKAFVSEKERVVGHGGNAIEEVIVPWIRIERERS